MDKEKVYYDEEGNFLKCSWDDSIEKDLKELHDIDLQQEMDEVMEYQLKEEKVREIFHDQIERNGYIEDFDKVSYFKQKPVKGDKMLFFAVETTEEQGQCNVEFTKFYYPSEAENFIDNFNLVRIVKEFPVVEFKE